MHMTEARELTLSQQEEVWLQRMSIEKQIELISKKVDQVISPSKGRGACNAI